jgi:hypothetical protein
MKRLLKVLGCAMSLLLALIVGYVAGAKRGADFTDFYRQSNAMWSHYLTAEMIHSGRGGDAYNYSRDMASKYYQNVSSSPFLQARCLLPYVNWAEGRTYVLFQADEASRAHVQKVAQFLNSEESRQKM